MEESKISTQKNIQSNTILSSILKSGKKFGFRSGKLLKNITMN